MMHVRDGWLSLVVSMILAIGPASVVGSPVALVRSRDDLVKLSRSSATSGENSTADSTSLKTWWHNSGEINTKTAVQNGNVRQSHMYTVQVSSGSSNQFYDSFVYESIPRNGNGNICSPGSSTDCGSDDQITIEPDIGATMAWTQFLYADDVVVSVSRNDGGSTAPSDVVIRPTTMDFTTSESGNSLLIHVPYNASGQRFSVEFADDLFSYHNSGEGEDQHYVQNVNPNGQSYVSSYTDQMPIVGVEPLNALLIFASPMPATDMVPNKTDAYVVPQGQVSSSQLSSVTASVLWFSPGVYFFGGADRGLLPTSVSWVYLEPGAYVKGAIEYQSSSTDLRATGFGVLSGEQYVYQANTDQGYTNTKSDANSLHMWRGESADGMTWTVNGLTTANPPFNSMDFYGNVDTFSVQAFDYKQVGAWFGQTDGIENYPNSHVRDIFYHVGDDVIKTYYSNVLIERVTIWKTNNAPMIQFGWYQRQLSNITVDSVNVIHSRYISQSSDYPRALVGSSASYLDVDSRTTANTTMDINGYTVSNWRSEGISPALLGMNPQQNLDNFLLSNIWIETLSPATTQVGMSTLSNMTDSSGNEIKIGANSPGGIGLTIRDFYVGSEHITLVNNNWDSYSAGMLDIDGSYWGHWTAVSRAVYSKYASDIENILLNRVDGRLQHRALRIWTLLLAQEPLPPPSTGYLVEYFADVLQNYTFCVNFDGSHFEKADYHELNAHGNPSVGDYFAYSPCDGSLKVVKSADESNLQGDYLWYDPHWGSLNHGGEGDEYHKISQVVGASAVGAGAGRFVKVSCNSSEANDLSCAWGSSGAKADLWTCKGYLAPVAPGYDPTSDCGSGGLTIHLEKLVFQPAST